ncbi:DapH/DapD/GlmU-related protein [Acidocella sp. C78]|uniref:DapH/DapD/GlmU-related protein n=1 Tax=Acidocella sp. C78 TaxID=1671486 RepID=UPI0024BE7678|nr:DapH/DapD/GlmU-related protein [Acidocella sp. C78]
MPQNPAPVAAAAAAQAAKFIGLTRRGVCAAASFRRIVMHVIAESLIVMDPSRPKLAETVIDPGARLREATVGRRCEVLHGARIEYATIGDYSYLGEYCEVADATIGRFAAIANAVRIGAPNHPMGRPSQHRFTYVPEYYEPGQRRDADFFAARRGARVTIGHDVWIGHGAIVLPGVNVGDGAVIAAGAVVSRDVEPYVVVGGVPARPIRERFPRDIAARLRAIAWWNWPDEVLFARIEAFRDENIAAFCDRFG